MFLQVRPIGRMDLSDNQKSTAKLINRPASADIDTGLNRWIITAGASAESSTTGTSAGASAGKRDTTTAGGYQKGMATFTVAKGGLMYEASIAGGGFSYEPL